MIRIRRCVSAAILGLLLAGSLAGGVSAQEVRQNPFLPEATTEEQRILAERERMRQAIREMMPEIRAMVVPALDEQRATLTSDIVAEVLASPGLAAAAAGSTPVGTAIDPATGAPVAAAAQEDDPNAMPEGSRFVGCINGKALYRDVNEVRYFPETESAAARCTD